MRKTITTVRFIKHESIKIGDTIKVEEQIEDCTIQRVGTVARREQSLHSTEYTTSKGVVLYTHWRDGISKDGKITLLNRPVNVTEINSAIPSLF